MIEQGLPDNHLKVRDALSSESSAKTRRELITALFEGKLELAGDMDQSERVKSRMRQSRITDLSQLAEETSVI
ncbi:MAG: hypothetical protein WBV94_29080 [Blastocatellia bacterium]